MLVISLEQIISQIGLYLLPFFRISSFFLAVPVFGTQMVPPRIRIGLGVLTTLIVVPLLPNSPIGFDPLSLQMIPELVHQVLIGVALGFLMQMFFQIFVIGGQMMAMQMALGMASMVDPTNGVSVTIVAQFYLILVTLVFMAVNGHLVMLEVLIQSFTLMPVGGGNGLALTSYWNITSWGSWMFVSGFLLALPAVTALLIVNFAFGVMTRAAPQLNIFSLGFPVSMVLGLLMIWMSLSGFLPRFDRLAVQVFDLMKALIGV